MPASTGKWLFTEASADEWFKLKRELDRQGYVGLLCLQTFVLLYVSFSIIIWRLP